MSSGKLKKRYRSAWYKNDVTAIVALERKYEWLSWYAPKWVAAPLSVVNSRLFCETPVA